jgi:broad specificity phosphatase PhoE
MGWRVETYPGPMSDRVHLVRHGEVENPDHLVYADLRGFGLSELGIRQAALTAEHLADRPIAAVYSSPLQRATETAGAIAASHGLVVNTVPELTEWRLTDRWKGRVWDDLDAEFPGDLHAYFHHPLDMAFSPESLEELAVRVSAAIEGLAGDHPGGEIVVVSHQDPIQTARLAFTHHTLADLHEDKPSHAEVFTFDVGAPWIERNRWAPAEQEGFPPTE